MHSLRKKYVTYSEVNTPLAMNIDDIMTNDCPTKSLRIELLMKDSRQAYLQWKMLSLFLNICYTCLHQTRNFLYTQ